jgi:hypothetical protein
MSGTVCPSGMVGVGAGPEGDGDGVIDGGAEDDADGDPEADGEAPADADGDADGDPEADGEAPADADGDADADGSGDGLGGAGGRVGEGAGVYSVAHWYSARVAELKTNSPISPRPIAEKAISSGVR